MAAAERITGLRSVAHTLFQQPVPFTPSTIQPCADQFCDAPTATGGLISVTGRAGFDTRPRRYRERLLSSMARIRKGKLPVTRSLK